jgi:hypothetical protein
MKSYRIKAANAAGQWSYVGLFACSVDAVIHAMDHGATSVSVKPIKAAQ